MDFERGQKDERFFFDLFFLPSNGKKMGILMERGIKGGVKRNKVRRRIKEMFRRNKDFLQDGFYLFKIKKVSIGENFSTLREDFFTLLKEDNLWIK